MVFHGHLLCGHKRVNTNRLEAVELLSTPSRREKEDEKQS